VVKLTHNEIGLKDLLWALGVIFAFGFPYLAWLKITGAWKKIMAAERCMVASPGFVTFILTEFGKERMDFVQTIRNINDMHVRQQLERDMQQRRDEALDMVTEGVQTGGLHSIAWEVRFVCFVSQTTRDLNSNPVC
jgi:hypothetical protein